VAKEASLSGRMVGVDVGGTFTDLVYLDLASGQLRLAKTPTTLDNQAYGFGTCWSLGDAQDRNPME